MSEFLTACTFNVMLGFKDMAGTARGKNPQPMLTLWNLLLLASSLSFRFGVDFTRTWWGTLQLTNARFERIADFCYRSHAGRYVKRHTRAMTSGDWVAARVGDGKQSGTFLHIIHFSKRATQAALTFVLCVQLCHGTTSAKYTATYLRGNYVGAPLWSSLQQRFDRQE